MRNEKLIPPMLLKKNPFKILNTDKKKIQNHIQT